MTFQQLIQDITENLKHVTITHVTDTYAALTLDTPAERPLHMTLHAQTHGGFTIQLHSVEAHQVMNLVESLTRRMDE